MPFPLEIGTSHVCLLSPVVLGLCLEPLASAIRQNLNIHGIVHNSHEFEITFHADHHLLFISQSKSSNPELTKVINMFGDVSSYSKAELLPMGDNLSQCPPPIANSGGSLMLLPILEYGFPALFHR